MLYSLTKPEEAILMKGIILLEVMLVFGVYHASKYASVNVETLGKKASNT